MMKANRIHRFGPPDVIVFEEIERPAPGANQVLVHVKAAGVGPWDALVRTGNSVNHPSLPLTLGSDLTGTIVEVGPGAVEFQIGDEIFGLTNDQFVGGYAEYAAVQAAMIARKPRTLSSAEAASAPVVTVTAWQMLFDHAQARSGQTVLVHGAAGNVGAYAVQMAKREGMRVIATANTGDLDHVRSLGADEVIDARATRFEDVVASVDAVIDTVGGKVQERSFAVLKRGGALISSVSEPSAELARTHGVRAAFFIVDVSTAALDRVAALFDAGDLKTSVGVVMPLADGRRAHDMLAGTLASPRGKIVLRVGE